MKILYYGHKHGYPIVAPNLMREKVVDDWKNEMRNYEIKHPLNLINEHFFLPTKRISITSNPSREQDVIALFNQLLAGGVIRGMKIMSTLSQKKKSFRHFKIF